MRYVVSLSGGVASAVAADLVMQRYGSTNVDLWYADTLVEDPDLHRFNADCLARWGLPLTTHTDGRTPLEVAAQRSIIPNNRIVPCTFALKIEPFVRHLTAHYVPGAATVVLGLGEWECERQAGPQERYEGLGYAVEYPLSWPAFAHYGPDDLLALVQYGWGIPVPAMYTEGYSHNNCFTGDTRFITDDGIVSLGAAHLRAEPVRVLTRGGAWADAEVRSFGRQPIIILVVERDGKRKTIRTTAAHRWFAHPYQRGNRQVELTTSELRPGMRLASIYGQGAANVRPSAFGVAHGIVFGDGTRHEAGRGPATVMLCGEKDRELLRYFPLSPRVEVPGVGVRVADLPRSWKDRPSLQESKSYLYGWLAGYFAADGSVGWDGSATLASARREHLEFVKEVCVLLGIGTAPIRSEQRKGYGEASEMHYMVLLRQTLREDLFILEGHRQRAVFGDFGGRRAAPSWRVVAVEEAGYEEEVYCAYVPGTHAFTLEDNILTGNCGGCCIRGGVEQWVRTYHRHYDRFVAARDWETAQRAKGGARRDKAFLKRTVGGVARPLSLVELEAAIVAGDVTVQGGRARWQKDEKRHSGRVSGS